MAERITIARPYARAVFEIAKAQNALDRWSQYLAFFKEAVSQPEMQILLENPRLTKEKRVEMLLGLWEGEIPKEVEHFLRLLAEEDRLILLPDIANLYEAMREEAEGILEAQVFSAFPLDSGQRRKIAQALSARLHREIKLRSKTDRSLLGGIVIHAGDLVIDGSVRGQLSRLYAALNR
ncbi:MAG: F0F1 ATP synthase subunit delta [Gammaproteobacteria bacterium]|nr:MAG: F0F1 ATP synthase subunit delta [Gammaproteobacteria bacterium]